MIKENLIAIKNDIILEEKKAKRQPNSVKLLAVSKFHSASDVIEAIKSGQTMFGENRVQEAALKFDEVHKSYPDVELHIIGTLQRNKVKDAVRISSCIESVDRIELLDEIEKQCAKIDKRIKVFFELHTGEESKSGFENIDTLKEAVKLCANGMYPHIIPSGFMTMAPFTEDTNAIKKSFTTLKMVAQKIQADFPTLTLTELSMGMSNDYKIAIEEGSTIVRIGTAIFGKRDAQNTKL